MSQLEQPERLIFLIALTQSISYFNCMLMHNALTDTSVQKKAVNANNYQLK